LSKARKSDLAALEATLGHVFADRGLLALALTHMSAPQIVGGRPLTYQRLEFLGDRVLGLSIAAMLYRAFPEAEEGDLSRRLASLVRKESCTEVATIWDIGPHLRLGEGERQSGARRNGAILADVCEAIIGAVYLDAGFDAAEALVARGFGPRLNDVSAPKRDAKTALQEWAQGRGLTPPTYREVSRAGPDHAPRFVVAACIAGLGEALGTGTSKRLAEQDAAANYLRREGALDQTEIRQ
jgi:ribonuclease-3